MRLCGKALLPLEGEPVIFRVMEALIRVPCGLRVLACPADCKDDFAPLAARAGFELFIGSKDDVLARYAEAALYFELDKSADCRIIRATGDNPFVFADAAAQINDEAASLGADYACYAAIPHGSGVESVAVSALLQAHKEAKGADEREHVCPYLYKNPARFALHRPLAPQKWRTPICERQISVTIDTKDDYDGAERLYRALPKNESRYKGEVIIKCAQ